MGNVFKLKIPPTQTVVRNPWQQLREFTSARIALGRSGTSLPTDEMLSFQLDHAKAMDAVHCALDPEALIRQLSACEVITQHTLGAPLHVQSKATDRLVYLQRPDLGRQLNEASWQTLVTERDRLQTEIDLAIVIGDGLSAIAIQQHTQPFLQLLFTQLSQDPLPWRIAPLTVATQSRVALGDDVAECLNAKLVLILIGERPGLTSPDSMGLYLTWGAKRGSLESDRNCISNVRPAGLSYQDASQRAFYLLSEARRRQLSGIQLKDRSLMNEGGNTPLNESQNHFLISTQ